MSDLFTIFSLLVGYLELTGGCTQTTWSNSSQHVVQFTLTSSLHVNSFSMFLFGTKCQRFTITSTNYAFLRYHIKWSYLLTFLYIMFQLLYWTMFILMLYLLSSLNWNFESPFKDKRFHHLANIKKLYYNNNMC